MPIGSFLNRTSIDENGFMQGILTYKSYLGLHIVLTSTNLNVVGLISALTVDYKVL